MMLGLRFEECLELTMTQQNYAWITDDLALGVRGKSQF